MVSHERRIRASSSLSKYHASVRVSLSNAFSKSMSFDRLAGGRNHSTLPNRTAMENSSPLLFGDHLAAPNLLALFRRGHWCSVASRRSCASMPASPNDPAQASLHADLHQVPDHLRRRGPRAGGGDKAKGDIFTPGSSPLEGRDRRRVLHPRRRALVRWFRCSRRCRFIRIIEGRLRRQQHHSRHRRGTPGSRPGARGVLSPAKSAASSPTT